MAAMLHNFVFPTCMCLWSISLAVHVHRPWKKICNILYFYACMYKQCSSVSIVIVLHLLALWTARALLLPFNFLSEFIVTWRNLNKKLNNVLQKLSICLILKLTKTTVQVHFYGHLWNIAIYTIIKLMCTLWLVNHLWFIVPVNPWKFCMSSVA